MHVLAKLLPSFRNEPWIFRVILEQLRVTHLWESSSKTHFWESSSTTKIQYYF